MNQRSDTDRVLRHWLADGPSQMPDRVLDVVADRIARQPQRRTWRLRGRFTMTPAFKYGIAAAAVLVIALVGYNLLPKSGSIGGPVATPTVQPIPTAAPSPTRAAIIQCEDDLPGCAGPLDAGWHRTGSLQPTAAYAVPGGWTNAVDTPTILKLNPPSGFDPYILVWTNPAIAEQTPNCDATAKPGLGTAVSDWTAYLMGHEGLQISEPADASIPAIGSWAGIVLDLRVADSWTETCPGITGNTVQFILNADPVAGSQLYGLSSTGWMRIFLLDVDGQTVIVQVYGPGDTAGFAAAIAKVQPVLDSLQFACGDQLASPCPPN